MPVTFNEIGVGSVSGDLIESMDVTKTVEHKVLKRSDGGFESAQKFDPSFEFTIKGRGPTDQSDVGTSGTLIPDNLSGGVTIIKSIKLTQTNEDFNSFEISGVNYPGASE